MTYPLPDREGEALAPRLPHLIGPCAEKDAEVLAAEFAPAGIARLEQFLTCPNHPAWRLPRS